MTKQDFIELKNAQRALRDSLTLLMALDGKIADAAIKRKCRSVKALVFKAKDHVDALDHRNNIPS